MSVYSAYGNNAGLLSAIPPKSSLHRTPFMRLSPPGTHFTVESTGAMRIKCLAQGHNMLMPGFEPPTSVSRNLFSNHMTNIKVFCLLSGRCNGLCVGNCAVYLCCLLLHVLMMWSVSCDTVFDCGVI